MNDDELSRSIVECLARAVPQVGMGRVDPGVSFRDQYEVDSLDFLNFALELEKEFGVEIPEEDYPKLTTVESCRTFLEGLGASRQA